MQLRWNWLSVWLPVTNAWNCNSLYTAFSSNVGAWGLWACSLFLSSCRCKGYDRHGGSVQFLDHQNHYGDLLLWVGVCHPWHWYVASVGEWYKNFFFILFTHTLRRHNFGIISTPGHKSDRMSSVYMIMINKGGCTKMLYFMTRGRGSCAKAWSYIHIVKLLFSFKIFPIPGLNWCILMMDKKNHDPLDFFNFFHGADNLRIICW